MSIRALILGAGGREHALAVHLLRSDRVEKVYVAPGNGGTAVMGERCVNLTSPKAAGDFREVAQWAVEHNINLVVPGPEAPLVEGVELAFRKVGIPVFGPSPIAAQMEGSKKFAKEFMDRHNIPTARFQTFTASQIEECLQYIEELGGYQNVVLKASGLAGGKGVLLPESQEEAKQGVEDLLVKKLFGDAGDALVVEERLVGSELSVLAFSDGYTVRALPGCQDHKRIGEGDTGLNTGGMGAYCPTPDGTVPGMDEQIRNEVLLPTINGMRKDGYPFVGMLFVGLMLTANGPKVLEYNVRFGDPETEAVLELLEPASALTDILMATVEGRLDCAEFNIRPGYAVSVVIASGGYPGKYATGVPMTIDSLPKGVSVYHAGTTLKDGRLLTAGGRVVVVSATGATLEEALKIVYQGVDAVNFQGMIYRRDIAHRALAQAKLKNDGLTYAAAGVDIDAGNALVERIKPMAKSTQRKGCLGHLGGFGGVFDLAALQYKDPVLVSGTDGVGTKLRVALDFNKHNTIGIDLVAMSVNDLIVQGAQPLYFLDYFACSKLDVDTASSVIEGVAEGCRQAESALIGGETAEMPGMYVGDEYDVAGFAVGAVERSAILPKIDAMKVGDKLIGLRSSGAHSNGYSLLRKCVARAQATLDGPPPWTKGTGSNECSEDFATLGDALLAPTRIYVKPLKFMLTASKHDVLGLAHITGGGFTENIPRMLPKHLGAHIDLNAWTRPALFDWVQKAGNVAPEEMARTFNNGIGMVLVVAADKAESVLQQIKQNGESDAVVIGALTDSPGVTYSGLDRWLS
ncbi:hypothetical protein MYAM1_000976 [Malassezia yamatoensis]|uniref:Phosphoribosylformylglycinamidine cyclo-ligase n=1 Tax=Malassezia yamatoensis TaxID=253288 RepID=A0AAJ5YQM4_9BASI|nr:hypothetical protein MYAM1_000976 [Malassezia yamatoensis]